MFFGLNFNMIKEDNDSVAVVRVVEDDAEARRSVVELAQSHGWRAVGYGDAESFLTEYDGGEVGCIVLDLRLPDRSGLQVVDALAEREGHVSPVVFMTGHGDLPTAVAAMKNTLVRDFVEKPFAPSKLTGAIERSIAVDRDVVSRWQRIAAARSCSRRLSEREREVLDALMEGKTNKQIAVDLGVSHKTVSTHRTHVLEKFECQSIVDVARLLESAETWEAGQYE
ncbi:MAG: response regulator transcription factor [Phycisphaerales bacterium]